VILNCDILDLRASMTEPFLKAPTLDLTVAVRFEWRDAKSRSVLATDEQSEHRSRKIAFGKEPKLPFDEAVIQDYGNELVNEMLAKVIEKEVNSTPVLHPQNK